MVYITSVHMVGGTGHEHISAVRWRNPDEGTTGQSGRAEMVDFIDNKKGVAKVQSGGTEVHVGTVNASPKYIRTHADGKWTDNLLALPRY